MEGTALIPEQPIDQELLINLVTFSEVSTALTHLISEAAHEQLYRLLSYTIHVILKHPCFRAADSVCLAQ